MRAALEAEQNVAPTSRTTQLYETALTWASQTIDCNGQPMIDDLLVRERLARLAIDSEVTNLLGLRVAFLDELGSNPGPLAALYGPETYLHWSAEIVDMVGNEALLPWTEPAAASGGSFDWHYRSAVATTIYGGSSEVLRSVIAEQRLGLPRSRPKTDRTAPPS
jgi:alkylation response protein AidB-like acyl-CoA dehydrogenase